MIGAFSDLMFLFENGIVVRLRRYSTLPMQGSSQRKDVLEKFLTWWDNTRWRLRTQTSAVRTWDMLQSWTQINFKTLIRSNINSSTNAIYMTKVEHTNFDFI
ncbi:hypothetical protein H4582DRAFT_2057810 [Lactarius indigo]|nr:hypothetical protein H4582DRAFT_2057810 [Lactarius indigo]